MKIMVVAPYFYPKIGGMENYAYNISKGLKEKYGWEVVVVTSNHVEKKYIEENIDGMKIYRLAQWFKISNTPVNPLWYFQIKKVIQKEKPDVINAHTPVPFISDISALTCGKIPFILTYHTGSMILKGELLADLLIRLYESTVLKFTLKRAEKILCSSDYVRFGFLKEYSNKTVTITPSVDINKFKPKKIISTNNILFVGSLRKSDKYKGLAYLLSAINIIKINNKDIRLTVVGGGDDIPYYKDLCKKLNIKKNVEFKGGLYGDDLVEEYQKTNVFVLPSYFDSCPLVLLEAMACKKPIIGTDTCGIPYIIDDEKNGLLVPPKNPEALSNAVIRTLKNQKLANKMGENGYKKVKENFTWEKQIKKTNDLLTDLI
jgi:glycosyltransferase involved in cell wall biosynthesis